MKMEKVRNCPKCGSDKRLFERYFGNPFSIEGESKDSKFVVKVAIDVCMDCNNVYASKWETIRVGD